MSETGICIGNGVCLGMRLIPCVHGWAHTTQGRAQRREGADIVQLSSIESALLAATWNNLYYVRRSRTPSQFHGT